MDPGGKVGIGHKSNCPSLKEKKGRNGRQVLDGAFLPLNEVGVPMPLCLLVKEQELHLKSAQWDSQAISCMEVSQ